MAKRSVKKKTSPKKKPSRKKKVASSASAAPRKSTGKKKVAGKKKTATKKKAPAKKAAAAKTTTKKKAPAKKAAETTPAKKKKKRRAVRGRSLGARSVAEAASDAKADAQGYVYINGRRVRMISTKGQATVRKSRTAKPTEGDAAQPEKEAKPIKTSLTAKELRHYRTVLLLKRAELVGDLSAMEEAALQARGGNLSHLPIHMADIGTDTFDQDFNLGLAESERQHLREIDEALRRIENKTYGVCQMTGEPIPKARLEAKPWAKYTIEAARTLEGQWRG